MNPTQTPPNPESNNNPMQPPSPNPYEQPAAAQPTPPQPTFQTFAPTEPVQPDGPAMVAPPVAPAQPQPIQPSPVPMTSDQSTDKDRERVKNVGIAFLALAILGLASIAYQLLMPATGSSFGGPVLLVFPLLQAAIAVGLLKYKWIAYISFNVIAALTVIGSLFGLIASVFAISIAVSMAQSLNSPSLLLDVLVGLLLQLIPFAVAIYGLIVLHPKRVRQLFAK